MEHPLQNMHAAESREAYLDVTIYKENLSQILDLIRLAPELPVDAVILHRLFNVYKVDPTIEYLSADEEGELFVEASQLAKVLKLELYLPPRHSLLCRIVERSIFVTAEGRVTPCCFLPEFYLGNALERGVGGIRHSKAYSDFVSNMKKHPICSQCQW